MLKQYFKEIVIFFQYRAVKKLLTGNKDLKIIAVAGSVGKTSTKRAIAITIEQKYKVAWQDGNYNEISTIPLVFFGLSQPSLFNPFAWIKAFLKMDKLASRYPYEVVVLEIGTDGPGQISELSKYFKNDIAVITPIAPEHMEFFDSIEDVAKEEISIANFSKELLIHESVSEYSSMIAKNYLVYGEQKYSDAYVVGEEDTYIQTTKDRYKVSSELLGVHQKANLAAACLVAEKLGLNKSQIEKGLFAVGPMPGRMSKLKAINKATIIDDTYNSSPEATKSALSTLRKLNNNQKIAVLGNMNELGEFSEKHHREIGKLCSPDYIDLLITIGNDANKYLAYEAEKNGCNVITAKSPYKVGEILKDKIQPNGIVLIKGSQNGVFLEEAIKPILENPRDQSKLVRQSKYWLKKKKAMFK